MSGSITNTTMQISDHMETIPILVAWYQSEWGTYYGIDGPCDAQADLESRCNRDEFHFDLVAIDDDQVLGTAVLDLDVSTTVLGRLLNRSGWSGKDK